MSQSNNSPYYSHDLPAAMFADCLANSKNIFKLIDTVFPVDSCRHYEVLPLKLDGNELEIGTIDPNNEESYKFVNSIAKVFKYNLSFKLIDAQTLKIILDSYSQNSQRTERANRKKDRNKTVIDATVIEDNFDSNNSSKSNNYPSRKHADYAPTVISQTARQSFSPSDKVASNLEGLPADLDFLRDIDLSSPKSDKPLPAENDKSGTLYEIPPEFLAQQKSNSPKNLDNNPTVIADNPAELLAQHQSELELAEAQISDLIAEVSNQIKESEKIDSVDFLTKLNSQLSWQKLLEQAFKYDSEEINLTRHSDFGSINAMKNEISQSSIKQIPLPIFCSLIDEIKRMAKIPLDISNHPKKVVLERFYQEERILIRVEFTAIDKKDTVVVQIFRGKNLAVYEQQQMDKMSEQALYLARQLEKTLRKIQACFDSAEFTSIRELQTIQSRINHQLRLLDK